MSILKSIISNATARTATEVVNRVGSAIFWVFVVRFLSASDLGAIAYGLAVYKLFSMVSSLGLRPLFSKDVAQNRQKAGEYFFQVLFLGSMAALVLWFVMMSISLIYGPADQSGYVLRILSIAMFTGVAMHFSSAMLWAAEKLYWVTIAQTVRVVLLLSVGLVIVYHFQNAKAVAWVVATSYILSHVLCLIFSSKVSRPVLRLNRSIIMHYWHQIPTFISITIAHSAFWTIPIIILSQIKGEQITGYFSAANKLVDILIAVSLAYGQALLPIFSKLFKQTERIQQIIGLSLRYVSMVTIAIAFVIYSSAPFIIHFLFGADMASAIEVLRVLIWLIIPYSMIPILSQFLISHDRQKYDLFANVIASITAIGLSFVIVPFAGARGLAISLLSGATLFFIIEFIAVQKSFNSFSAVKQFKFPLIGFILMAMVMSLLGSSRPELVLPAGVVIYICFLAITGSLDELSILIKQQR